jgi:hypothetical protein
LPNALASQWLRLKIAQSVGKESAGFFVPGSWDDTTMPEKNGKPEGKDKKEREEEEM